MSISQLRVGEVLFVYFTVKSKRNSQFTEEVHSKTKKLIFLSISLCILFWVLKRTISMRWFFRVLTAFMRLGNIAQSVTCLATDASLTAEPGVASSIPAQSYTFVEIDKRKYVHGVLVNCLVKLDQEKVWLGELTVPP